MSGLLTVLPVMLKETADICIGSMLPEDSAAGLSRDEVLIVDNSREGWAEERYGLRTYRDPDGHNLGVARSWNVGAREVLNRGLDYLVLMSASMRFGPMLHTTWVRQMETFWGSHLIESEGHSWHLIAIHREALERVGLFDGAFYPGYVEADDWITRMVLAGLPTSWPRAWVNALSQGVAIHVQELSCPWGPLRDYYAAKWGGPKGEEVFTRPWDSESLDYFEDVPIPELARRYKLETWW